MLSASALPFSTSKDDLVETHTRTSNGPTNTKSTSLPLPTITDIVADSAYCFTPNDGDHVRFSHKDAKAVVLHFCSQNPIMEPSSKGVTDYHFDGAGNIIHVSAKWANDQTGCAHMQYIFSFTDPDDGVAHDKTCLIVWDGDYFCDQSLILKTRMSYGGGFVLNTPRHGYIEFKQWVSPPLTD
jgi:hypothetical protein